MIEVVPATQEDALTIHHLAMEIWPEAYKNILSQEQIEFMLNDNYSVASILLQMKQENEFVLLKNNNKVSGFASFSETVENEVLRIHKLYIHPNVQGKGAGRFIISFLSDIAIERDKSILELNVNRNNPAKGFYLKMEFEIFQTVDIPYHHFILNDFIMRKQLKPISRL